MKGSPLVGYMPPQEGPFECGNCKYFQAPNRCGNPKVQQDPQVRGQVEEEGCCNEFESAHKETQEQEHSEGMKGAPMGAMKLARRSTPPANEGGY